MKAFIVEVDVELFVILLQEFDQSLSGLGGSPWVRERNGLPRFVHSRREERIKSLSRNFWRRRKAVGWSRRVRDCGGHVRAAGGDYLGEV